MRLKLDSSKVADPSGFQNDVKFFLNQLVASAKLVSKIGHFGTMIRFCCPYGSCTITEGVFCTLSPLSLSWSPQLVLHTSLFELLFLSRLRWRYPKVLGKRKWSSNITSTPSVMDDVSVAAVGPFPELDDF